MLAELYVNALLADERAADEVWELWDAGLIADEVAELAWLVILTRRSASDAKLTWSAGGGLARCARYTQST
jgi:hypothetical protein